MQLDSSLKNMGYDAVMAGRPPLTPATDNGARIAFFRKQAGLSQSQLAQALDIPQRTISFYERQADSIPSSILPKMANVLGVSINDILGLNKQDSTKRGPKSKLQRQLEAIQKLPRDKQRFFSQVLDQLLASNATTKAL